MGEVVVDHPHGTRLAEAKEDTWCEQHFRPAFRGVQFGAFCHDSKFSWMSFEQLIAQVHGPFKKMDDPRMSGDYGLAVCRNRQRREYSQGPQRTHSTAKHKNLRRRSP